MASVVLIFLLLVLTTSNIAASESLAGRRKDKTIFLEGRTADYEKGHFEAALHKNSQAEVLEFLGQPSHIDSSSPISTFRNKVDAWTYFELEMRKGDPKIFDPITKQIFNSLRITFRDSIVQSIYLTQSPPRSCFPTCF